MLISRGWTAVVVHTPVLWHESPRFIINSRSLFAYERMKTKRLFRPSWNRHRKAKWKVGESNISSVIETR